MNIFVTDLDPREAAHNLDDKRLIKMILETAQMLSTNINLSGLQGPYRTTHANHPATKWARESHENYLWLCEHFAFLCDEYYRRFHREHKCEQYRDTFYECSTAIKYTNENPTPFVNCTIYKDIKEITVAYRNYLNYKWKNDKRQPKWTNANPPAWKEKI